MSAVMRQVTTIAAPRAASAGEPAADAAPRGVLAHPLGRDVVAPHREAGPDQVLGEGRPQQAHADARDGLAHVRVLLGRHHTASGGGPH